MNLKKLRKSINFSQAKLAMTADISQGYLSSLERGEKQPTLPVLKRLAAALNLSVAELISEDSGNEKKSGC